MLARVVAIAIAAAAVLLHPRPLAADLQIAGRASEVDDVLARLTRIQTYDGVTDRINPLTAAEYGTFENYWAKTAQSRTGKFAEAHVARGFQRHAKLHGLNRAILPTGLADPSSPFDLIVTDTISGRETRYQMKLGNRASVAAIRDSRYSDGNILTTPHTLREIRQELQQRVVAAERRGTALAPKWQSVKGALTSGRLTDNIDGYVVKSRKYIERLAQRFDGKRFGQVLQQWADESEVAVVARAASGAGEARLAGFAPIAARWGGRAAGALGAATSLYRVRGDYARYEAGVIGSGELAARGSARVLLTGAGVWAAWTATGPVGWVVGGIAIAEYGLDRYDEAQVERFRRTLDRIELNDRYSWCRSVVMADLTPPSGLAQSD